jgi:hypothetical protein
MQKKVILLGLNEINFKFIELYIAKGYLPNFKTLFEKCGYLQTTSEKEYKLLEPWIQWVTIHTGKTFEEHKIFRLGDIVGRNDLEQLWEIAEKKGLTTAAISPFNAQNRLANPIFFIPDPWTKTNATGSNLLKKLASTVSSAVNENANNKLGLGSAFILIQSLLAYIPLQKYPKFIKLLRRAFSEKGLKAAFLDVFLGDIFLTLWKKNKPDFSSLFLNAGAHIQHHYMFNSKVYDGGIKNPEWFCPQSQDPLLSILEYYDKIIQEIISLENTRIFIATGLHQNPHLHRTYYYRLKNHKEFLKIIGIDSFIELLPRMSRDFLVTFNNEKEAVHCQKIIESIISASDNEPIFEVDNRGKSLFIELTYGNEINEGFNVKIGNVESKINLFDHVSFIALKNGEHDSIGYFVDTNNVSQPSNIIPLKETFSIIVSSFN